MEPLKIGVFSIPPHIEPCMLGLTKLTTNMSCQYLGIAAEILGLALEIAQLPYELAPFHNYTISNVGAYDDATAKWSGMHHLYSSGGFTRRKLQFYID